MCGWNKKNIDWVRDEMHIIVGIYLFLWTYGLLENSSGCCQRWMIRTSNDYLFLAQKVCRDGFASNTFLYSSFYTSTLTKVDPNTPAMAQTVTITVDNHVRIQADLVNLRRRLETDTSFGMHCDAVSYISRPRDLQGKLEPQKVLELEVPKGSKRRIYAEY